MAPIFGRSHERIAPCAFLRLSLKVCLSDFISQISIVKVFVFKSTPVGYHQSVGIVLGTWHILHIAGGEHGAFEVARAPLDNLRPVVAELCLLYTSDAADDKARIHLGRRLKIREKIFIY